MIKKILDDIPARDAEIIRKKMLIASKIDAAINAKGWDKNKFALEMGVNPKVVSIWLSGDHNFTISILTDIEYVLGAKIIEL